MNKKMLVLSKAEALPGRAKGNKRIKGIYRKVVLVLDHKVYSY